MYCCNGCSSGSCLYVHVKRNRAFHYTRRLIFDPFVRLLLRRCGSARQNKHGPLVPTGYSNGLIDVSRPQPSSWSEYSKREVGVHASLGHYKSNRVKSYVDSSQIIGIWFEINIDKQCRLALRPSWKPESDDIADPSLLQIHKLAATCRPSLDTQTFEAILNRARKKRVGTALSIRIVTVSLVF